MRALRIVVAGLIVDCETAQSQGLGTASSQLVASAGYSPRMKTASKMSLNIGTLAPPVRTSETYL